LRIDSRVAGEANRRLVLEALRAREVVSRTSLAHATGLSKATMTVIVDQLMREGFLDVLGPGESGTGRRPTLLRLNPRARLLIGVELSDSFCSAVLTDLNGQPVRSLSRPTSSSAPGDAVAAAIALVDELRGEAPPGKLLGVGVGTPSAVDPTSGAILNALHLGWRGVPVAGPIAAAVGLPVVVLNRAKAAALGEGWSGAGRKVETFVYLSVSNGISAGLVIGGKLYRGVSGSEGEFGHTTTVPDGPLCLCGNRGCLQTLASATAILARVREQARGRPRADGPLAARLDLLTLEDVGSLAEAGDELVLEVVEEVAHHIGIAAANVANMLNPRLLIVGGSVPRAITALVPRIDAVVRRRALPGVAAALGVVPSRLGAQAVPIGAAALLLGTVSLPGSDNGRPAPSAGATGRRRAPVVAGRERQGGR
jgi:predicted NBD/HSP70 family sugar kinase